MAAISSLGVGSGLDLGSLVSSLLASERAPIANRLAFKEQNITTELSAFGLLRSSLSQFQTSLSGLQSSTAFNAKEVSTSENSVFSTSVENSAETGSYTIEVTALAKAHSLASNAATAFATVDDVVGTGTMTIQFGTTTTGPYAFTPDPASTPQIIVVSAANQNTTLSGLRDYINDNNYGLQASIVNDGNGYRLLLSSQDSGVNNSMEITVSGDGDGNDNDNSGLSQLAFNASAQTSLTQTVAAQDAALSINGLNITRDSNTVTGAINGVTLDLLKAEAGTVVNLEVKENRTEAKNSISGFIQAYNDLADNIKTLTRFNPDTGIGSVLIGDFTLRSVSNQIRHVIFDNVAGLNGNIKSLINIGITTNSNGTLDIDNTKLEKALDDFPSEVATLFRLQGAANNVGASYFSATTETRSGSYAINITSAGTRGLLNGASGVNSLTVDANNDNLTFSINGVSTGSLSLTQGLYADAAALATEIQSQINSATALQASGSSVTVSYDGVNDRFIVTADEYGINSSVEITAIDVNSNNDFGFSIAQGVAGIDFAGTIDGNPATVNGKILTSQSGNSRGLAVEILSPGTVGSLGTVSVTRGLAATLDSLLDSFLGSGGFISAREEGLNEGLEDIADQRIKLDDRISSLESRLIRQFSALDALVAQFNQTSNFLTLQLASLPKPNSIGGSR